MYEVWSWRWQRRTIPYGDAGCTLSLCLVPPPDCICDRERAFAEMRADLAETGRLTDAEQEAMGVTLRLQLVNWAAYWAEAHPEPYARSEWGRLARFFENQVYLAVERDAGRGATEGTQRWRDLS